MRCLILSVIICYCSLYNGGAQDYIGQRYDRQRLIMPLLGPGCTNLDTANHVVINGVIFDFNADSLSVFPADTFKKNAPVPYWTYFEGSQICNKEGKLAAYFNGVELWDRNKNAMELDVFKYAYPSKPDILIYNINGCMMLPMPQGDHEYVLLGSDDFHYDPVYGVETGEQISAVYFTEGQAGDLTVTRIDSNLHHSKYTFNGIMQACRHANGRDWWIACPKRRSKVFNMFLLDEQGVRFSHECLVSDTIFTDDDSPVFSPDGTWFSKTHVRHYSQYSKKNHIQFFHFDRCTGTFSDSYKFVLPYRDTMCVIQALFDATSRYCYIGACTSLFQIDMWAENIAASLVRVCDYDPMLRDAGIYNVIGGGFLAPDGKMYFFDARNNFRTTVVHHPSEPGLACDARYAAVLKPSCTGFGLGNMPDFNLGSLDGSPCDTLGLNSVAVRKVNDLQYAVLEISPNPASGSATVFLPSAAGLLKISDISGKIIRTMHTQDFQMELEIELPAGVYLLQYLSTNQKIFTTGKLVMIR